MIILINKNIFYDNIIVPNMQIKITWHWNWARCFWSV